MPLSWASLGLFLDTDLPQGLKPLYETDVPAQQSETTPHPRFSDPHVNFRWCQILSARRRRGRKRLTARCREIMPCPSWAKRPSLTATQAHGDSFVHPSFRCTSRLSRGRAFGVFQGVSADRVPGGHHDQGPSSLLVALSNQARCSGGFSY